MTNSRLGALWVGSVLTGRSALHLLLGWQALVKIVCANYGMGSAKVPARPGRNAGTPRPPNCGGLSVTRSAITPEFGAGPLQPHGGGLWKRCPAELLASLLLWLESGQLLRQPSGLRTRREREEAGLPQAIWRAESPPPSFCTDRQRPC